MLTSQQSNFWGPVHARYLRRRQVAMAQCGCILRTTVRNLTAMTETNLQDWVGRTSTAFEIADGERAARLATLLGHDGDPVAPLFPLGHWLHFSEDGVPMSDLGADGHAALGGFLPPVLLPRRMWAGSDLTFHAPILPGQTIERTTTIESITEKTGSTGPLCFVVLRHEITADGKPATTETRPHPCSPWDIGCTSPKTMSR